MSQYSVGIDIGGTFTDIVVYDNSNCHFMNIKVPTTPTSPAKAAIESLKRLENRVNFADVGIIFHSTTIATNAILGQENLEIPKTAFLTTHGFRDVLEIGRQKRHELYNLFIQRPRPLVPRRYRFEIRERIDADGTEIEQLSLADLEAAADAILRGSIKAVAIGFLNSYVSPSHEERAKEVIGQRCPGVVVITSSRASPEYREYERFSTAVINAALSPVISAYVKELAAGLKELGIRASLFIMQSTGGITTADMVVEKPATIIESGPASGVLASAFLGKTLGIKNILSFDMGGTTAKAGAIRNYVVETVAEYEVGGRVHRGKIVRGSGYPVRFSFVDLAECSAGGGTIAWVDSGVFLRVGPLSAGAEPGPACYGKGGENPTVTDSNIILGRLNPHTFLGGEMKIHPELARTAIHEKISLKTGLSVEDAALGIVKMANAEMSKILRIVSVERGHDPREFALFAFGGAGPMHACALAEELNIEKIVVPSNPGLFSALGLLVADFTHQSQQPVMKRINDVLPDDIERRFGELEKNEMAVLMNPGLLAGENVLQRQIDARYVGQSYEISLDVPGCFDEQMAINLTKMFHERHRQLYGHSTETEPIELINLRVMARRVSAKPSLKEVESGRGKIEPSHVREVYFEDSSDFIECPVLSRDQLNMETTINGPAIIEQYDSTTVVYPKWRLKVDAVGNILLTAKEL